MPYIKVTKDLDGAFAEAVATEIAQQTQSANPALDSPDISVQMDANNRPTVVLPYYRMGEKLLSDLIFEHLMGQQPIKSQLTPHFLRSFGCSLALRWFCGEGDVNPTNFSVVDGRLYSFDFDCCFESIQSDTSFAKTRIPTFVSINLNERRTPRSIIIGCITNIFQSFKTMMPDDHVELNALIEELTTGMTIELIQEGFHDQLKRMACVNLRDIISKQIPDRNRQKQYMDFLENKQKDTRNMIATTIEEKNGSTATWASFFGVASSIGRCFGMGHCSIP